LLASNITLAAHKPEATLHSAGLCATAAPARPAGSTAEPCRCRTR
jgi:hypothetical protein